MSKFGMKIASETVYGIVSPDHALDLIEKVIGQYFGEYWTQHKPRCPLCDTALSDTEKHMNRPVGECTNSTCESTIHIADFFGKIKDVLVEWKLVQDTWKEEMKREINKEISIKKIQAGYPHVSTPFMAGHDDDEDYMLNSDYGCRQDAHERSSGIIVSENDMALTVDNDMLFIW